MALRPWTSRRAAASFTTSRLTLGRPASPAGRRGRRPGTWRRPRIVVAARPWPRPWRRLGRLGRPCGGPPGPLQVADERVGARRRSPCRRRGPGRPRSPFWALRRASSMPASRRRRRRRPRSACAGAPRAGVDLLLGGLALGGLAEPRRRLGACCRSSWRVEQLDLLGLRVWSWSSSSLAAEALLRAWAVARAPASSSASWPMTSSYSRLEAGASSPSWAGRAGAWPVPRAGDRRATPASRPSARARRRHATAAGARTRRSSRSVPAPATVSPVGTVVRHPSRRHLAGPHLERQPDVSISRAARPRRRPGAGRGSRGGRWRPGPGPARGPCGPAARPRRTR